MEFRRLLPGPERSVEIEELLDSAELLGPPPDHRPYTVANFIASADGRATLGGRSGGLGDEGDRAMFHGLREHVDAVLAGTGTLSVERYGRILGREERRQRRVQRGRAPEPLACMITRSGELPADIPLFACPEARLAVFAGKEIDLSSAAAHVDLVVLDPGELTLTTVMRRLHGDYGVRSLLCEGGPMLFGALLSEQLIDELFLTVAPKLAGGGHGPAITAGAELATAAELELIWLLERAGSLFLRYRLG